MRCYEVVAKKYHPSVTIVKMQNNLSSSRSQADYNKLQPLSDKIIEF